MYIFLISLFVVCASTIVIVGADQKSQSPRPGTPIVNRVKETETRTSPRNIDAPVGDHFRKSHSGSVAQSASKKDISKSQPPFNAKSTKVKIPNS